MDKINLVEEFNEMMKSYQKYEKSHPSQIIHDYRWIKTRIGAFSVGIFDVQISKHFPTINNVLCVSYLEQLGYFFIENQHISKIDPLCRAIFTYYTPNDRNKFYILFLIKSCQVASVEIFLSVLEWYSYMNDNLGNIFQELIQTSSNNFIKYLDLSNAVISNPDPRMRKLINQMQDFTIEGLLPPLKWVINDSQHSFNDQISLDNYEYSEWDILINNATQPIINIKSANK